MGRLVRRRGCNPLGRQRVGRPDVQRGPRTRARLHPVRARQRERGGGRGVGPRAAARRAARRALLARHARVRAERDERQAPARARGQVRLEGPEHAAIRARRPGRGPGGFTARVPALGRGRVHAERAVRACFCNQALQLLRRGGDEFGGRGGLVAGRRRKHYVDG